jgi:hypothetical protein
MLEILTQSTYLNLSFEFKSNCVVNNNKTNYVNTIPITTNVAQLLIIDPINQSGAIYSWAKPTRSRNTRNANGVLA